MTVDPHIVTLGLTSNPELFYDGWLIEHDHPALEHLWYWPNFSMEGDPRLYDRDTGLFFYHVLSMDTLQALRDEFGEPLRIISGHRGPGLNRRVGGTELSCHKRIAFDISVAGMSYADRERLVRAAIAVGFTSVGIYNTFIHVDVRLGRVWGAAPWAAERDLTVWNIRQIIKDRWAE